MDTGRPKLDIPYRRPEWILEALAAGALLMCLALPIVFWTYLPDKLPGHYDMQGNVTREDPKAVTLITLPAITVALYALLTFVSRIPHLYNYPVEITPENAARQYRAGRMMILVLKFIIPVVFGFLLFNAVQVGLGNAQALSPAFYVILFLGTFGVAIGGVVVMSLKR